MKRVRKHIMLATLSILLLPLPAILHPIYAQEETQVSSIYYVIYDPRTGLGTPIRIATIEGLMGPPKITVDDQGKIYVIWAQKGDDELWRLYYKTLQNGVWSQPTQISNPMPYYPYFDVRWSYHHYNFPQHIDIVWNEDDGSTSTLYYGNLASGETNVIRVGGHRAFGPVTIERQSTGRITVVYQSLLVGKLYSIYSDDNGITWSSPVPCTGFPNAEGSPHLAVNGNDLLYLGFGFNVGGFYTTSADSVHWSSPRAVHDGGWGTWDYGTIISIDGNNNVFMLYRVSYGWADPPYNVYLKMLLFLEGSWTTVTLRITNLPNNQPGPPPGYDYAGYGIADVQVGPNNIYYVTYYWRAWYVRPYYPSQRIPDDYDRLYLYDSTKGESIEISMPYTHVVGGNMIIDQNGRAHIVFRAISTAPPVTSWFEIVGGNRREYATDASSGSLYVVGSTKSFKAKGWDIFLAKFDGSGHLEQFQTFGGRRSDIARAVEKGTGLYIGGDTNSFKTRRHAGFIAFYSDAEGVFNIKLIDSRGIDRVNDLAIDASETQEYVYVVGLVNGRSRKGDAFLAKFDRFGELQWARVFGGRYFDEAIGVAIGDDGYVYVAGITGGYRRGDVFLAKFGEDGTLYWVKSFGTRRPEILRGITADSNGIYLTGQLLVKRPDPMIFIAKFSYSGNLDWFKVLNAGRMEDVGGIAADGPIYITGTLRAKGFLVYMAKLNPDGSLVYYKLLRARGVNRGLGITIDQAGRVYIVGSSMYGSGGSAFLALVPPDTALGRYTWTAEKKWPLSLIDATNFVSINSVQMDVKLLPWEADTRIPISEVTVTPTLKTPEEYRAELTP